MPVNSLRHFSFPKLRTLLPVRPLRKIMSVSTGSGAAGATDPTDPGTAFKLLLSCPSGLPASRIWSQRIQQNPSLYNGIKFRDICGHKPESSMGEVSCSFNRKFPWKCLMVSFVRWLKKLVFLQARCYEKFQGDLKQMAVKMPGCHRGGYALYKLMMEAAKDS
ncbi:hypothetical protein BHE74_00005885 [Ensete ventricosum]|nr:hypothetical protein BHE74_00005885 [Ensete ventricosum]